MAIQNLQNEIDDMINNAANNAVQKALDKLIIKKAGSINIYPFICSEYLLKILLIIINA